MRFMKARLTTSITLGVLGAALSAPAVQAQEMNGALGAWATIQNLSFTVIDLDLNDGVAASMSFVDGVHGRGGHTYANAWTSLDSNGLGEQYSSLPLNTEFMPTASQTSSQAGVFANTTVSSNGMTSAATATVLGATGVAAATSRTQFDGIYAPSYPYTLWLTPNTQLMVSALASTFAAVGTGCGEAQGFCGSAFADARLIGRRIEGDRIAENFTSSFTSNAGLGGISFAEASRVPTSQLSAAGGLLSITFTNATAALMSQHLTVETSAVVTAVPEPSTYALMAMGVALVALRRRRHGSSAV